MSTHLDLKEPEAELVHNTEQIHEKLKSLTQRAGPLYFIAACKSEAIVTKKHNPMLWLKGCQTPIKFLRYSPVSDA